MTLDQPTFSAKQHTSIISGQPFFYRVAGTGSPLVLLHGYGVSSYIWERVLPHLAHQHQLFLLDLPGYGRSPLRAHPWRLRAIASLLVEWLREMRLPPVTLVGQSMGGALALHLAVMAPELVENLILVSAAGVPVQATLPALVGRSALSICQPGSGGYPWQMLVDTLTPRPRIWWDCAQEIVHCDLRPEMTQIAHPTLILWGTRDLLLPVELGRTMRQVMPRSRFVEMPRSGHRPMLTEPAEFSRLVLEFLRS